MKEVEEQVSLYALSSLQVMERDEQQGLNGLWLCFVLLENC